MLEKEKKESEEEYNVLVNRSNIRFKENRLNAIYNSYYSETN